MTKVNIIQYIFIDFDKEKWYNILYSLKGKYKKEDKCMASAIEISKYVISYFNNNNINITNLKLQKILYYIQGYYLKKYDLPAFSEPIYNWPYGPVVPDVYFEYNEYGNKCIFLSADSSTPSKFNSTLMSLIRDVISKCANYTAFQLVDKTHSETPWLNSNRGEEISIDSIHSYFSSNNPLLI